MPNVVVVGAGGFGAPIAHGLSAKLDSSKHTLTVITSRPYFTHYPALLRVLVTSDRQLEDDSLLGYDKLFQNGNGSIKVGTVTGITKAPNGKSGTVELASGESVPWDVLVLTPGSLWEAGLSLPEGDKSAAVSWFDSWAEKFKQANSYALVGAGAVGIELAGELRDVYPNKKITLIHGDSMFLNDTYPAKFRKDIERRIRIRRIDVLLSNHVDTIDNSGTSHKTREGTPFEADLIVPTRGGRPNTEFIKSLGTKALTPYGRVNVKPTLQVEGETNVFAAGDVIEYKEQKQVAKAAGHAPVIIENVIALLSGSSPSKEYKGSMEAILVTNGKNGGAGYMGMLWGVKLGDYLTAKIKSKTLLVGYAKAAVGLA
ncbi:FAD/NAD-P-binding domain-containing protein [Sistotremastrum niveocremeum HHB9708]|uniref:FAD/NAD-P-binding domain-containing protein n=1 Tax=Sistotremastrum niveocremeum HHB9708 TaxID=1314777 RepID=A0A164SPY8_9AGAM|nr:FAD/NAD-P-binding domain-containing protein [Sistotremastrum niveocremeum HHB9708]